MADKSQQDSGPSARDLLVDFLAASHTDEAVDFESLCEKNPQLASALLQEYRAHQEVQQDLVLFGKKAEWARETPRGGATAGEQIGDFRLVEILGRGGMGEVWRAEQISLARQVALKLVLPERVNERNLSLFAREARAGGKLTHRGIVAIYGSGENEGVHWIAEELIAGGWTLRDFLDEISAADKVPGNYYRELAVFVARLADALEAAHSAGVIHRDLKPQNVLITEEDEPKLTDFGLARITDEEALSQTGEFAGTYLYMSPEQVAARRAGLDHRTDIFSLGVMLFEMLTLQRPFEGDTTHQIAEKILTWDPPSPKSLRSRVPEDLAVICTKALEKSRDQRYQSMGGLAADLRRFLAHEPILAKPPSPLRRAQKWMLRHPTKSVVGVVAAAAFAAISALGLRLLQANAALEAKTFEAQESAAAEKLRADEVLRLALAQDLQDLVLDAETLWPAVPAKIDALEDWLDAARKLMAEVPALKAKREELRELALDRTPAELTSEEKTHPEFSALETLRIRIALNRSALAVRRGTARPNLAEVNWDDYPADSGVLNQLAWKRVAPTRRVLGQEALGLALARRALELAPAAGKAVILDTVAWGWFALGADKEALAASQAARSAAGAGQEVLFGNYTAKLEAALASASSADGLASAAESLAELEKQQEELEVRVHERRTWTFPKNIEAKDKHRWWHNQLTGLIEEVEGLGSEGTGLLSAQGISPEYGWSIPRRLRSAQRLATGFAPTREFSLRWQQAKSGLRAAYPGLDLSPQLGLVPLGPDPETGLFEFWHVQSGSEPLRAEDESLLFEESSGLVFVLLPGGDFWMGAQATDPDGQNWDPEAEPDSAPVHTVTLSAFFLSKYELTQGQWTRLAGTSPSIYGPNLIFQDYVHDLTHPVEQVSWFEAMDLLPRFDLRLPSEAEWEYGTRGGRSTVWWTGDERESLKTQAAANIADQAAQRWGNLWGDIQDWPELNDGFVVHAPVDSFSPNPFGLHHVHGNVSEWCLDGWEVSSYSAAARPNPVWPTDGASSRVRRGGDFSSKAFFARSARRYYNSPDNQDSLLGLRPARGITRQMR
ncbi:MAG: bifunctional serine/threonine-protein kinase/formylglycine-generating enzyme family protein [bacterium]|nr:hypothetical protein [Planctomycetota bacterium]HIL50973.1 hypothetical protein [Planctomycetota bacterium]